ncbi:macro domain-containing protein [Balneolales bacterium ANBcel1]|nr:macro domain-containing protein [Balneolales bacterium ANBcel1]
MTGKVTLECLEGDITRQGDLDAVVNAANAELRPGGGVAGAIHRAAGPELEEACRPHAPIKPGEAIITSAFGLPNKKIIHCLGPVYNIDRPSDQLLAQCYRNSLMLADREKMTSIGFPAVSTGAFGYPLDEAAEVAAYAIHDTMRHLGNIKLVRMVLFSPSDRELFCKALAIT